MTEITKNQFFQILGLVTASIALDNKRNLLADAYGEIVGKDEQDRFWDWGGGDGVNLESDIVEKLKFDKITIKDDHK